MILQYAYDYKNGRWVFGQDALPLMRIETKEALRELIEGDIPARFAGPLNGFELQQAINQTRRHLEEIKAEELRLFQARDRIRAAERRKIWYSRPSTA